MDTPFNVVGSDVNGYRIVMGDELVSELLFDRPEDAIEYILQKQWKLLLVACAIYTNKVNELKAKQK